MIDLTDKSILITGGTGSLGHALVARLLASPARRIAVLSRDELKQHEMAQRFNDPRLRFLIGDVRDRHRLYRAFKGVDIVIHAAALKQVPVGERDPLEVIATNVNGAANIIDAAIDCNVSKVLAISTDKACSPTNLYGATKLCSEKLFSAAGTYDGAHRTIFAVCRYGNVANSRGSVIPLWQSHTDTCGQYPWSRHVGKKCDGIGITDPRMTRFWITLDQAVDFVLANLARMNGGELFIPKLPSVRITDLARAVAPDCRVSITGIRQGEKLHEALVSEHEPRIEFDDHYIVGAGNPGPAVTSENNTTWLDAEAIRSAL